MRDYLAILILPLIIGGMLWFLGPSLLSDISAHKPSLQTSFQHTIGKAECNTRLGFISLCSIEVNEPATGVETEFDYFILSSMSDETVEALADVSTGYVTTSIGIDYLTNRIVSLLALLLLLAAGFIALVRDKLRG